MDKTWVLFVYFTIASFIVTFPTANCEVLTNYIENAKAAIASMRTFFAKGMDGLVKLLETIDQVEQFVDATIEEECEPFTCPDGK